MILNQLHIAQAIVTITFAALIGSVALGAALAFGLGGRDVARRMLEEAYDRGQDNKDKIKQDIDTGKDRAQDKAQEAKTQVQSGGDRHGTPGATPAAPRPA